MSRSVYIIAEAGVNHNGSLELAKRLIDVAADAKADAVKFQTFRAASEISRRAKKAQYQIKNTGSEESQLEMALKLELGVEEHRQLIEHAGRRSIDFLSTPFDLGSLSMLTDVFRLARIKMASGEITNLPLLLAAGRTGTPLIVSTGMATLGEIEWALAALAFSSIAAPNDRPTDSAMAAALQSDAGRSALHRKVSLLHCTTEYPAPPQDVNLNAMATLRAAFGLPVGYSDHTQGIHISVAAVAAGASIIEKHLTLDRTMPGPDHVASLEPAEMMELVRAIRDVESALGDGIKRPAPSEVKNISIARKSLVAARDIAKGALFSEKNLTTKRPGTGISAMRFEAFLGRPAPRDYEADELIDEI